MNYTKVFETYSVTLAVTVSLTPSYVKRAILLPSLSTRPDSKCNFLFVITFRTQYSYHYQVLAVEQVSVDAKEGGNDCCIYLAVEQVYYT